MGLHTNWHKTKIQNIGTGDSPRTVHIDNQAVQTVSRFTYLQGSDIDSDGYSYPEIHRRMGIAGSIMVHLTTSGVSKDLVSPPSSEYSTLHYNCLLHSKWLNLTWQLSSYQAQIMLSGVYIRWY